METAVLPEQRAQEPPVELDESDQDLAHRSRILDQSTATLAVISAFVALPAAGLAFTTRSTAGNSCWRCRKDSRTTRFILLRLTALPAAFTPTASPSLA